MFESLFRKKSISQILKQSQSDQLNDQSMKKILGVRDLTLMGIAAVIGAGIFSTIGGAAYNGGPGVIYLFLITAITCGFTAMCYAEFSARVPVSGSAYTYSYVAFGEIIAWIIGWALILEYAIGNIVVAVSWSAYFNNLLQGIGVHMPAWLTTDPTSAKLAFEKAMGEGKSVSDLAYNLAPQIGSFKLIMNVPACIIVLLISILVYIGIKESKKSANFMVVFKIVILLFVVGLGIFYINTDNWTPFMPNGFTGILKGVSAVFYAYIGFDAISTTAEECKNPQRDLPRGMIYSLLICTVIYVVVTLVITGMVNYREFDGVADPLAFVFDKIGQSKIGYIISFSAVIAATSVILVFQIGQPRIWMSMSRDGLLPKRFASIHPRFKTPAFATVVAGLIVAIPALFVEPTIVTDLTSIGTLFAFVLVCGGILMLPKEDKKDNKDAKFRVPFIPSRYILPIIFLFFLYIFFDRISDTVFKFSASSNQDKLFLIYCLFGIIISVSSIFKNHSLIPVLGMLCCMYLMIEIPPKSWLVFFAWMAVGLVIYFLYSYRNSRLGKENSI
jgi:basic amino acid/polyamine antiporter, APA family